MHHEKVVNERDKRLMLRTPDITSEEGLDALPRRTLLHRRTVEAYCRRALTIQL